MEMMVGASIFLALFILIAGVMWLKEVSFTRKTVEYTVLFPNVGALQIGDPVTVNGVKRGEVSRMYLHEGDVAVDIKVDKSINITDSSDVTVQNIGLMGERMVGIRLSTKGTAYTPNKDEDKTYIEGDFDSGIAEAMGMLGNVLTDVQILLVRVSDVMEKTIADPEFVTVFNGVVGRLDTVSLMVGGLLAENEPKLNRTMENLETLSNDVQGLLDANKDNIDEMIGDGSRLVDDAVSIAERVDSVVASLQSMVTDIENGEGSIGKLMDDEEFYDELKTTVSRLDTLVNDVNENGLKLRVKLGFRNRKNND
jgi:phospholipid/cholesterol/gamma-HCH transport system substrate-binding protein